MPVSFDALKSQCTSRMTGLLSGGVFLYEVYDCSPDGQMKVTEGELAGVASSSACSASIDVFFLPPSPDTRDTARPFLSVWLVTADSADGSDSISGDDGWIQVLVDAYRTGHRPSSEPVRAFMVIELERDCWEVAAGVYGRDADEMLRQLQELRQAVALCLEHTPDPRMSGELVSTPPVSASPEATDTADAVAETEGADSQPRETDASESMSGDIQWDDDQAEVLNSPPTARLLVEAPPGAGKTEVACGRVAALIDAGVAPSNIMLVSFTRAAVAEIRDRIGGFLGDPSLAFAVRITTLDSQAWHLLYGFTDEQANSLLSGYEENINRVIELLRDENDQLLDYLEMQVEHLIVDEAQDLVGDRAVLVAELIDALPPESGVTVFADPAQAIYGFASEEGIQPDTDKSLLEMLADRNFKAITLRTIHRTDSPELLAICTGGRGFVLGERAVDPGCLAGVSGCITSNAATKAGRFSAKANDWVTGLSESTLVLFRRRIEALMASSFLTSTGQLHRLRMGKLPSPIHPWIGRLLSTCTDELLSQSDFDQLWDDRHIPAIFGDLEPERAWGLLVGIGHLDKKRLNVRKLREQLSRSRPPDEVVSHEVGVRGPILGTIHASKGREAPVVHLMLPKNDSWEMGAEERLDEARVLYVGATRAREELCVGDGWGFGASSHTKSGRAYRYKGKRAQIEFGLEGDVDPIAAASRGVVGSAKSVQERIARAHGDLLALRAESSSGRYVVNLGEHGEGPTISRFTGRVSREVSDITGCSEGFHDYIQHLHFWGAQTIAVCDEGLRSRLDEPYRSSGFALAPIVRGFTVLPRASKEFG